MDNKVMALCDGMRRMLRAVSTTLLGVCVMAAGGCASFQRDFAALAAEPASSDDMAGAWEGSWVSDVNGHTGSLRCILTPLAESEGDEPLPSDHRRYRARFRATYAKILSFSYTMPLMVRVEEDGFHFAGEADLGWLAGGVYSTEGRADATQWESTYRSKHDHGRFMMTRVAGE